MKYETATPYTAAYVILRKGNEIAFVLRKNTDWMSGYYGLPSGKIEKGESVLQAACREAKEEIGVQVNPEQLKFVHVVDRHDEIDWIDFYFEVNSWKGQPFNAEPHVHSELAWFSPKELPDNIIPSVAAALDEIQKEHLFSQHGW